MDKFRTYNPNTADEKKREKEKYDDKTSDSADDAKNTASDTETSNASDNEIKDAENLPSSITFSASASDSTDGDKASEAIDEIDSDLSKTSDVVSSLFGNLVEVLDGAGTRVRDNLYTVDYITSMFSYDTMEKETVQNNSGADKIYQRTADVIQVNLLHQGKEDEGYQLQNAYCYFKMKCSIEVDPTMMGSSLLRDLEGNPYMQTDWRSFEYTCIRGY